MQGAEHSEADTVEVDDDFAEAHGLLGLALAPVLDGRTTGDKDEDEPELKAGDVVGRYTLLEQIGKGGFGIVWRARQNDVLKRMVALKIIRAGMNSRSVIRRFERERKTLALMSHPGISTVLDAGTTANHRPYFVMELLKGAPINRYAREHDLTGTQCLELMIEVCAAVQHAHQKGVLHRDLKPSNILIVMEDGRPQPKIIDFGIAKVLHAESQELETLSFTARGIMLGTPAYMAPEHATLGSEQVDVRADVFSLGAVLYEMLARCQPYDIDDETRLPANELFRRMCESEAVRPSTRIVKKQSFGEMSLRHARLLRGEIDWLVLHALEKDPDERYPSVTAMAEDLQRYLNNEPLSVGPPSAWYRFRKLARRHRAAFALGTTIVVSVMVIAGLSIWMLGKEKLAHAEAETNRARAEKGEQSALEENQKARHLNKYLGDLLQSAGKHVEEGKNPAALRMALDECTRKLSDLDAQPAVQVTLCESLAGVYQSMGDSSRALPLLMRAMELSTTLLGANHPQTQRLQIPIARAEVDVRGDHTQVLTRLGAAVAAFEAAGQVKGKDWFDAQRYIAQELSYQGRHQEALELMQMLSTKRRDSIPANEDSNFLRGLADIQRRAGALDDAEHTLQDGLHLLRPNSKSKRDRDSRSRLLQSLSRVMSDRGDQTTAISHLEEATRIERLAHGEGSHLVDLMIETARLVADNGDMERALRDLGQALLISQRIGNYVQQAHVQRARGDVLEHAGRQAEAVSVREKCERLGRDYPAAAITWLDDLNSLAILLARLGRTDEALEKSLDLWKNLEADRDAKDGDRNKLERIYSGLIEVISQHQARTKRNDHDDILKESRLRLDRLKVLVP